nr:TRAP transporter small permease [Sneathiella chinensis]
MLFIVVSSVIGRVIFDVTGGVVNLLIPGAIELASYALVIMVFASLPRAAISGLVSVDLVIGSLPATVRRTLERIWDLLLAAFACVVGWLFSHQTLTMFARGDKSQDLGIPLYTIYAVLTVCSICIALTGIWLALRPRRPEVSDS